MVRAFGEGDDKIIFELTQYAPKSSFELSLTGKPVKIVYSMRREPTTDMSFAFEPAGPVAKADVMHGTQPDKTPALIASNLSVKRGWATTSAQEADLSSEQATENAKINAEGRFAAGVTQLRVTGEIKREVVLQTGPLDQLFAVMRTCTDDLATNWGLDAEKIRHWQQSPKAQTDSWRKAAGAITHDSPAKAASMGNMAILRVRQIVDEQGVPGECTLLRATKGDDFGRNVCRNLSQVRFDPAIDADGQPMAGVVVNTIRYIIPN